MDWAEIFCASVYQVFDAQVLLSLKNRMVEILHTNPWLMSRIRHMPDDNRLAMIVDQKYCNIEEYIFESVDDTVSSLDFNVVKRMLMKQGIKYLSNYVDQEENGKLTKFAIIKNTDSSKCAVFLSINHILGDGSTLYHSLR